MLSNLWLQKQNNCALFEDPFDTLMSRHKNSYLSMNKRTRWTNNTQSAGNQWTNYSSWPE